MEYQDIYNQNINISIKISFFFIEDNKNQK